MSPATLTIGHGNGKNKPSVVRFARKAGCASFGFNEADRLLEPIGKLRGYRMTVAPSSARDRRAGETPLITSTRFDPLGELAVRVSEVVPAFERLAPDRWMTASMYAHPLALELGFYGIAHVNLHPSAGPFQLNGSDPAAPTTREYGEAMTTAGVYLELLRREGFLRVLTGDLQMRAGVPRPWSPDNMFRSAGMLTRTVGIDWIGHDRALELVDLEQTPLFDHPGLIAKFRGRVTR